MDIFDNVVIHMKKTKTKQKQNKQKTIEKTFRF